jgi:predicted RNA-binding Zn-ribbon protein involved in translation (DUF1610 family)
MPRMPLQEQVFTAYSMMIRFWWLRKLGIADSDWVYSRMPKELTLSRWVDALALRGGCRALAGHLTMSQSIRQMEIKSSLRIHRDNTGVFMDQYRYTVCPNCKQDTIIACARDSDNKLFLHCEECEWGWNTPAEVDAGASGFLALDIEAHYASRQALVAADWLKYHWTINSIR